MLNSRSRNNCGIVRNISLFVRIIATHTHIHHAPSSREHPGCGFLPLDAAEARRTDTLHVHVPRSPDWLFSLSPDRLCSLSPLAPRLCPQPPGKTPPLCRSTGNTSGTPNTTAFSLAYGTFMSSRYRSFPVSDVLFVPFFFSLVGAVCPPSRPRRIRLITQQRDQTTAHFPVKVRRVWAGAMQQKAPFLVSCCLRWFRR